MKYLIAVIVLLFGCQPGGDKQLFVKKEVRQEVGLKSMSTVLEVDAGVLADIMKSASADISLAIPHGGSVIRIDAQKMELFADGFAVVTDDGGRVAYEPGLYYVGKVRGEPESVAAISLSGGEVAGLISASFGDLNLGRSGEAYMLYATEQAVEPMSFACGADGLPGLDSLKPVSDAGLRAMSCVSVDFELTNEIYLNFNGDAGRCADFMTTLFAGVKAIYLAEGIDMRISSIFVWTKDDGYSDNAGDLLNEVKAKRGMDPSFKGNFVHVVRGQSNSLSGIAYVGVLCVPQYRVGFSAVVYNYQSYPAYSWSTMVVAHELGHNMGSPHTQNCGWPGGAIDNCYTTEGGCAPGPQPKKGGGTLMSYCHMRSDVGIEFRNGFGPLPGAKIRDYYGKLSCSGCSAQVPTCGDGIKNGTETGVDCGGNCPPCRAVVSLNRPAQQSSGFGNSFPAAMGCDGITGPENFMHTNRELQPWWQVDLGASHNITGVDIINRIGCCQDRLGDFKIFVGDVLPQNYGDQAAYNYGGKTFNTLTADFKATGRYVRIWANNSRPGYLNLSEVSVYGVPAAPCVERDTVYRVLRDSVGRICR